MPCTRTAGLALRAVALVAAGCLFGWAAAQDVQGAPPDVMAVVEGESGRVSVLDGGKLELLRRLLPRQPLLGEPKVTPDGRYAIVASRDGWLAQYDLADGSLVAQVRAGLSLRDFAISADGRWILAGNVEPQSLSLFDARLNLVRTYPSRTLDGKLSSAVSSVHDIAPRKSFLVAFEAMAQLWEISYDPTAAPIFDGLVHDYRMGEAIATAGFLGVRRIPLDEPVAVVGFDAPRRHVLVTRRGPAGAGPAAEATEIVNLDIRRRITTLPLRAAPSPHALTSFAQGGRPLLAVAAQPAGVAIIDPAGWRVLQTTPAPASPLFVVTHTNVRHLWVGSSVGKLTLIDKETLQVARVIDVTGGEPVRVDFNRDGSRALVSVRGRPGSVLAYDTQTLAQVRRLEHAGGPTSLQCPGERCTVALPPPPDPATAR